MTLEQPEFEIPGPVRQICRRLTEAGESAFVVGGSLRDLLAGREPVDWDVATSARPQRVMELFERVIPTGVDHGTVTVLSGRESVEVTTLRGEGAYSDGRHPDTVEFLDDIAEDLARRDFTINAIAYEPAARRLHDPLDGRLDLERGLIRAVGDAAARFGEDGLRVLRAARFAAVFEFEVEAATLAAMPAAAPLLARVSAERKRDELLKTLAAGRPSIGLELMQRADLLPHVAPDLAVLTERPPVASGPTDAWQHTLARIDACPPETHLRLAAMLLDLKRGPADASDRSGITAAQQWLDALRLDRRTRQRAAHLLAHLDLGYGSHWSDAQIRRSLRAVGREQIHDLLAVERADLASLADPGPAAARLDELERRLEPILAGPLALTVGELAVSGNDLMRELSLEEGPRVGRILEALLVHVLEYPEDNSAARLIGIAANLADRYR